MVGWLVFIGILVLALVPSNNEYDEVEEKEEFENYSSVVKWLELLVFNTLYKFLLL